MKTMTIIGAVFAVCCVAAGQAAGAMPTERELASAEPLIQELMHDDLNALRTGKKTREQVGDAAAALAREAQSPAEKYLLFTGAFDQYMRGGNYDKADSALNALREAIPGWKSSDEFALIDKALRSVPFGKGGPVRERYEALKGRQQYAAKLKKAQALAQAKPTDKRLQFQVAAYQAALGDWPAALDAFIAGSNPACADAAKLEKESAAPGPAADAWWSAADVKPDFLSSAIRAHAVDLYKKALADPSFVGLPRVAAEKRIAEVESAARESVSEPIAASYGSKKNPYVTKGLVAMWDGEWNVALGKHDDKAKKWNDIVGKNHCEPVGAPTFSGMATVLDGNSCWKIETSPELTRVLASDNLTVEIVARFDKNIAHNEGLIGIGASSSRALWIWGFGRGWPKGRENGLDFQSRGGTSVQLGKEETLSESANTMTIVLSSGELNASIASETATGRSGASKIFGPNYIGYIDGFAKFRGAIFCVRIYDRPLDKRELQKNRSVDVRRFAK